MSSNPQPLRGRTEADGPLFEYKLHVFYPNEGGRTTESGWSVARQLAARLRSEAEQVERAAGLTPQASSAERDKEELVERIAAELADYCLNIGPNTRDLIASGSWKRMPLSVSERRDIAELAATEALKPREEL